MTQRRILTLLDNPARLGDLHVGRSVDTGRLAHEAVRLQHAGLIACETTRDTSDVAAANAATMRAPMRRLARPLPIAVVLLAASVAVGAGWRYSTSGTPPSDSRRHAGTAQTPGVPVPQAPAASNEPPVIATRVLKGEVIDRNREAAKDRNSGRTPASPPSARAATGSEAGAHDPHATSEVPADP